MAGHTDRDSAPYSAYTLSSLAQPRLPYEVRDDFTCRQGGTPNHRRQVTQRDPLGVLDDGPGKIVIAGFNNKVGYFLCYRHAGLFCGDWRM